MPARFTDYEHYRQVLGKDFRYETSTTCQGVRLMVKRLIGMAGGQVKVSGFATATRLSAAVRVAIVEKV